MSAVIKKSFDGIRTMREEDLDEVIALEESVYPFPWTRGIFHDCLSVGYSCWVFQQDEKIIAYIIMSIAAGEAHILTLVVDPEFQGQGYAKKILQYALDLARERNTESVYLEVRPTNERAIGLYKKAGFNEIGFRKGYYPAKNGYEDALVMALSFVE